MFLLIKLYHKNGEKSVVFNQKSLVNMPLFAILQSATIDFDKEIINFLKIVSLKTATLSDITDSILKWIEKENLADKIILSIKA